MDTDDKLNYKIGELLAKGIATTEIISTLVQEQLVDDENTAVIALQVFYAGWQSIKKALSLQPDDVKNWHIYLRHEILKKAMKDDTPAHIRTALTILESLADIQGVQTDTEAIDEHELTIVFEPVEKITPQPNEDDNQT